MLPTSSADRKDVPLATGVLDYFPAALAQVAKLSKIGNDKHNPGEELHHARGKSMDHADCILRHLAERGSVDVDGFLHEVKVAWRALALLQEVMEERGAPLARAARVPEDETPTPQLELPNLGWFEGDASTTLPTAGDIYVTNDHGHDVRMVPVITGLGEEGEAIYEVPNNIDERIAGDTVGAKAVKNEYYRDLIIGKTYDVVGDDQSAVYVCCLLLGFQDNGDAVFIPWGLSSTHSLPADKLVPVQYTDHWAEHLAQRADWLTWGI